MNDKKTFTFLSISIALVHCLVIYYFAFGQYGSQRTFKAPVMYTTICGAVLGLIIAIISVILLVKTKTNITVSIKKILICALVGLAVPMSSIISSVYFCSLTSEHSEKVLLLMINPLNHIAVLVCSFLIDTAVNWSFGF